MKICLIAASLNILGGQAVQATEIVEQFKKEGVEIYYLPINPQLKGFWRQCQKYKFLRTIVTSVAYIKTLFQFVPHYDVIHIFSASYLAFLIAPTPAVLIGKFYKKKVILNYHSGEADDHLARSQSVIKWVLKFVDIVVVPSDYLQKVFLKFGIKTSIVYNVIDPQKYPFKIRNRFQARFLSPRNLEPMYNIGCVLKAFRIIQDQIPEASLAVLGYGSEEQRLKELAKTLKLQNIQFTGRVERRNVASYFQKADFMLNASNIDNLPMSILEAFSTGIPVITTSAGGIPFMIRDAENGVLVPLNGEKKMAEAAINLLENQNEIKKIVREALGDCGKYYTWEANREKWLDLYGMSQQ